MKRHLFILIVFLWMVARFDTIDGVLRFLNKLSPTQWSSVKIINIPKNSMVVEWIVFYLHGFGDPV